MPPPRSSNQCDRESCLVVHSPAVDPDLAVRAGERADAGHLDHRGREVAPPPAGVGRVRPDQAVRRRAAAEERLVGVQQPPPGEQVPEVAVVEVVRRRPVERLQRAVAGAPRPRRAAAPQRRREGGVDVGVVVDPGPAVLALRPPDGVGPCDDMRCRSWMEGWKASIAAACVCA